ncbi:cytidylyltransferase domain-containing protein [Leptospira perdikensis]|uniref:Cytidylyltransferase n=1 Tax=Leptospira perdikensis TaxID=2484948 RepID=A0A4R9JK18_9LEPT|nr:cytidylyltransferase [Leptospira perdikensis]TGL45820.1 cytidylyltransferase [Leptospira perdikensis]
MIVALLLGRKGSIGFPGKNTYPINGKPLAWYPMNVAKNTKEIDKIYLSTDDPELMKIAREENVEVIERPPHLATKEALGEHAYQHGFEVIKERNPGITIELVVLLFCNAATLTSKTVAEGIKALRENSSADSAVTVSKYNMWSPLRARKKDDHGFLQPFVPFETFGDPKTLNCDRDSQGDVLFADMGLSIVRPKNLINLEDGMLPQKWMGQKILPLYQEAGCDVDYEWQIPVVEWWLKKYGEFN